MTRPREELLAAFRMRDPDNRDHHYCCQLKAAAEADLEKAWEERQGTKVIREQLKRRGCALTVREGHVSRREMDANKRDDRQCRRSWYQAAVAVVELVAGLLLGWGVIGG